jgi:putative ABC transport system permease protein
VSNLKDVSGAAGVLVLNDVKLSGTVSAGGGQPGAQGGAGASGGSGNGSINSSSFTVTGVDPADDSLGPVSSGTITSGHSLTSAESDSNVAVVDSDYAKAQNLKAGSTITVAGKTFTVVGIVQAAQGATSSDV